MPKLSFRVDADTSPVKKFRTEIEQIEKTMLRIKGENFSFDHWIKEFDHLKTELEKKRSQIDNIKKDILNVNPIFEKKKFGSLNTELSQSSKERDVLINDTIALSNRFGKAYDDLIATLGKAQKVTDEVTASFIEQKQIVANLQSEVRSLNAEYRNADKGDKVGIRSQITSKQKELEQQRVTLNALKAEQERAKLAVKGLSDETRNYEKVVGKVSGAQAEANLVMGRFESTLLKIGGLATLKKFADDVIRVRGEFQKTQVAFETMLGSKEKSDVLMSQMVETAAKTPFDLQGVADGAKQLLAYGTSAENVNDTLIRLGNIASGLSIPLGDMVYLYGTTQTQGRLFTQDVRQFMGRGIPLVKELASMLGKTEEEINKMVTAGKIGFPEVEKVIKKMTDEGGQFHNLMEKQSQTLSGQISNLGDAWDSMLNSIGEDSQGLSSTTISMATSIVENYEEIGRILIGLIATYGAYKTASIAYYAITKTYGIYDIATKELQFAATMKNVAATKALAIQQTILNKTTLANPYVLVAATMAGIAYAIYKVATAETEFDKAAMRLSDANSDVEKSLVSEISKLTSLERKLSETKTGTEEYNNIKKTIVDNYGQYYKGLDGEIERVGNLSIVYGQLVENMRLSIGQRKFESFFKAEQDNLDKTIGEKLDKAYDTLIEKYGKDKGGRLYQQVFNSVIRGNQMPTDVWKQLNAATFKEWGFDNSPVGFSIRSVSSLVSDVNRATQASSKSLDEFKEKYQITDEEVTKILSGSNPSENKITENKTLKQLILDIDASKSKIKELQEQANKGLISSDKIKEEQDILSRLTSDYKNRTGNEYGSSPQDSAAEKLRNQQEKYALLMDKQKLEQKRQTEDLQSQTDQARINAMREGASRTLEQMKLDHQKEIQQLDRQQEDLLRKRIEDEKAKFNAEEDKKAAKDPKYKKLTFDGSNVTLSQSEKDAYDNQRMYLGIQQAGETQALLDKERQAWNDYLAEYGTFQQKKEAIAIEYNERISKATTEGERASLEKEKENKIKEVNFEELKSSINFADVFGDLDSQSTESIVKMRDKLKEVIDKSAKDLKPTDLKALQDAFKDIDLKISERDPFGELKQGINEYKESTRAVIQAQEDLNTVQQGGEVIVGLYADETGKLVPKLLTQQQAEQNLSKAQRERLESQSKLTKSVNSIGQNGKQLVEAGSDITNMLTDLGVEVPESITGTLDGLGQVMDGLASIDFTNPISAIKGVTSVLAGVGKIIGSLFGGSDSTAKYEALKEQLDAINEIYQKIIDKSKEKIVFGEGFAAVQAASDALDTYYKKIENYRRVAEAGGKAGSSSGSHSYAHRANERLTNYWSGFSKLIGQNISSIEEMYNLTGDQLYLIQTKYPEAWGKIPSEITDSLNAIIDCKDEVNELNNALNAAMTGIDTDSFYNGFIDSLADMDSSFEDMCDDFEGYLRKSIIAGLVASQYKDRISDLYKEWSEAAQSDKKITEDESNALREKYKGLVEDMMNDREQMAEAFGWGNSSSQSSSSHRGFGTEMTHEDVGELSGRFTALQISNEEIKNQAIIHTDLLSSINEKISLLDLTKENLPILTAPNYPNFADRTKEIIASSYQTPVNVIFPDAKLDALTSEVSSLKGIVDEMRAFQIGQFPDITEGVAKIAKNIPVSNTKLENINNGIKRFNGR